MKFSVGDEIVIRVDVEELQNDLLQMVDGMKATVSEVYQNVYEPDVDRYEVELVEPIEFEGKDLVVIPGLYEDNLERVERLRESRAMNKSAFFKKITMGRKFQTV